MMLNTFLLCVFLIDDVFPHFHQLPLGQLPHCPKLGDGTTVCSPGMILIYVADIFNVMFHPIRKGCLHTCMGIHLLRCSTIYILFLHLVFIWKGNELSLRLQGPVAKW